jgi:uncharacterized protein (TIGR02145 family)
MALKKVLTGSMESLTGASFLVISIISITILIVFNTCEKPERVIQLTTLEALPADISYTSAILKGEITDLGSDPIEDHGMLVSDNSTPISSNSHIESLGIFSSKGSFQVNVGDLMVNTTYFFRAFVNINGEDIYAEEVKQFKTKEYNLAELTTSAISALTSSSATTGGNISEDGGTSVTSRGVCWNTAGTPTLSDDTTINSLGTGIYISNITGLTPNTIYYIRAYATNSVGTAYGNQLSFVTDPVIWADIEGNSYNVIRIGTQLWMKENLKTTKYNDNTAIPNVIDSIQWTTLITPSYCWYNNNASSYKNTYGALYNWYTIEKGKLCPTGWHVPSDAEWTILESYLILNGYNYDGTTTDNKIAKALASPTGWASSSSMGAVGNTDYPAKRNATGFSALPGGFRAKDGAFRLVGRSGNWWSSSLNSSTYAWFRYFDYTYSNVGRSDIIMRYGFSVRCIKD